MQYLSVAHGVITHLFGLYSRTGPGKSRKCASISFLTAIRDLNLFLMRDVICVSMSYFYVCFKALSGGFHVLFPVTDEKVLGHLPHDMSPKDVLLVTYIQGQH